MSNIRNEGLQAEQVEAETVIILTVCY